MTSFLTRAKDKLQAKYKLDVNEVVSKYDAFLQYGLVTTSSFQNILDGKLNRTKRAIQLAFMLDYCFYVIPRYSFLCSLYFQDDETRIYYQYILADYGEEMGMFGRTFNFACIIFPIGVLANYMVLQKFEKEASLEFLTDWLKIVPKKTRIEDEDEDESTAPGDLDNKSRHKLISGLHYKMILAKITARITASAIESFDLIAFPLFIYKKRPSFFIICRGLWNCIGLVVCIEQAIHHAGGLYFSYVMTTDYFKVIIDNIIRKAEVLKTKGMTNGNVISILDDYDAMMSDFKKYNRVLKPLLRNLVYFYVFGLTNVFVMLTIKIETWMLAAVIPIAVGHAFMMLATGVYYSQLHGKVAELHDTLASLCARHAGSKRQRLSLNCIFRLKHVIQELGSLETDGQFVIGLRDGEGGATSRMEIFDLTMDTVGNTLMILGFLHGMENM